MLCYVELGFVLLAVCVNLKRPAVRSSVSVALCVVRERASGISLPFSRFSDSGMEHDWVQVGSGTILGHEALIKELADSGHIRIWESAR